MVKLPDGLRLQSSRAEPTPLAIRDDQTSADPDPLNGSLGPFLVSCVLIIIIILAVSFVFWGVHRRSRFQIRTSQHYHAAVSVGTGVSVAASELKAPPSRLRIRSPIQRLRLLRSSSQNSTSSTIPLFAGPHDPAAPVDIPEIVCSHPSPSSSYVTSPSLTTTTAPAVASQDGLQVPLPRWMPVRPARPAPLIQLEPRYLDQPLGNRQPPKYQAKVHTGSKLPFGSGRKSKTRGPAGKENALPSMGEIPARVIRKIAVLGSRYAVVHFTNKQTRTELLDAGTILELTLI